MTITREREQDAARMSCDVCGRRLEIVGQNSVARVLALGQRKGWVSTEAGDACPPCHEQEERAWESSH